MINQEEIRTRLDNLRSRISIDPTQLEKECVNQPILYDEIGELTTEYQAIVKGAENHLDFVSAEISTNVRKDPAKYGVDKVTDKSVESTVVLSKEYQAAVAEVIESNKVLGFLKVLQNSVEQRKPMINNLVTLYVHNFYGQEHNMGSERKILGNEMERQIIEERLKREREKTQQGQNQEEQE